MSIQTDNIQSRLLVLVPDDELDEAKYAKKARALAESLHLEIVFVGMIRSHDTEPLLRRRLITLSGIAGIDAIKSRFIELSYPTWLDITSREFIPGDYILCPEELIKIRTHSNPGESMQSQYGAKLIVVAGIITPMRKQRFDEILQQVLNWAGILVIMGTAFGLEASFDNQTIGITRILGEVILVSLEVGFLWFWFKFFQRIHY
jgi:hypothetical protein